MKTHWASVATVAAVTFLVLMTLSGTAQAACEPTPGVAATEDVAYGKCLFSNRTAFGQNPLTPFPKCASCHYSGTAFQDKAVHFNILKNSRGRTLEVQRNTPRSTTQEKRRLTGGTRATRRFRPRFAKRF